MIVIANIMVFCYYRCIGFRGHLHQGKMSTLSYKDVIVYISFYYYFYSQILDFNRQATHEMESKGTLNKTELVPHKM